MKNITLSLVIPTFNRVVLLRDALESIAQSRLTNPDSVEVIVVDNNSTDDTSRDVEKIKTNYPFDLQYVFESHPGSSQARNKGISVSRGPYTVFMDDDQRIDKDYLAKVENIFKKSGAACVGGPVRYYNANEVPAWSARLINDVGQYDAGDKARRLDPSERMLGGGNMAFEKDALLRLGGFDENLGRHGDSLMANEDIEIQERLYDLGEHVFYSPELIQYHYLRPERLTKKYWRRHQFDRGRTMYRHYEQTEQNKKTIKLLGTPRWLWRSLLTKEIPHYLQALLRKGELERFEKELEIFVLAGRIYEARTSHRRSRRPEDDR